MSELKTNLGFNADDKVRIWVDSATGERGFQMKLTNKTGSNSVKGTVVEQSSTTDSAFSAIVADEPDPIGVVYEAGVADGSECWIWLPQSLCQVLLEDGSAATREYWVKVSDTDAGRADASNAAPPGGTIAAIEDHFTELGHAAESQSSGTDVLCLIHLHFN
jgi:hypothetical protein